MREGFQPPAEYSKQGNRGQTSEGLRKSSERILKLLSKDFKVEGQENLQEIREIRQQQPDSKFVITSSHISNLDAPAAVKVFGEDLDMQIAVSSRHFGITPQELMYRAIGKENFTAVQNRKSKSGETGVFNPDNFTELAQQMEQGKTPWIAAHPFTKSEEMQKVKIGAVYLAQKTKSYLIPAALELRGGGSISMEGPIEILKGALKKPEAIYHIGKPVKLEPVDVSIIDTVLSKRREGEKVTPQESEQFSATIQILRDQAAHIEQTIAQMLPESMRRKPKEKAE
ncbi:MAG TPA: hypothetical protein VE973_01830 [Candidatus Limnocylindria bacterium]|nr:hypothetical protein [Candidatus Limnocylindria bacterium]